MIEVAPLRYGVVFKKAFCDLNIFKAFVKDILDLELEIDRVETEKEFDPPIGYVKARFDLFAEDKKNRIIVDIQHERDPDHYDRFLYYHCAAMLEQIAKFEDYRPPLQVFTIVVLTSGDKYKRDVATIEFDPKDRDGKPLGVFRHRVVYLCPKYVDEHTPQSYREWLAAINDSLDSKVKESDYQRPEIHQIFDRIKKDLISPAERYLIIEENKQLRRFKDATEKGHARGFKKGLAEGLAEGIAEGREKGIAAGREEGREEGRYEAVKELARKMLGRGLDAATVAEMTGLTTEEVRGLAAQETESTD